MRILPLTALLRHSIYLQQVIFQKVLNRVCLLPGGLSARQPVPAHGALATGRALILIMGLEHHLTVHIQSILMYIVFLPA